MVDLTNLIANQDFAGIESWLTNARFLWIANIWQPDSLIAPNSYIFQNLLPLNQLIPFFESGEIAELAPTLVKYLKLSGAITILPETLQLAENGSISFLMDMIPQSLELAQQGSYHMLSYVRTNGLLIMPLLAGATTFISSSMPPQAAAANEQTAGTAKFMKYFFPVFSAYLCLSYNAGFAMYWVFSNVYQISLQLTLKWYYKEENVKKREEKKALKKPAGGK